MRGVGGGAAEAADASGFAEDLGSHDRADTANRDQVRAAAHEEEIPDLALERARAFPV